MGAVHGRAHWPTGPVCPARRSLAPFLPLMMRAIAAGAGAAGAGGTESVNAK
jgi:hypothetical protein